MSVQERRIVNEAEEEAKSQKKKVLGIFPRRAATSGSGTSTPVERKSSDIREQAKGEYEMEDDDLPPREEADLGSMAPSTADHDDSKEREEAEKRRKVEEEARKAEERALQAIPKTAGFDFSAISKELGKEIDLQKLKEEPVRESPLPTVMTSPVDRTGSAPPEVWVDPPVESARIQRSHSSFGSRSLSSDDVDDSGDITFATNQARQLFLADTASWSQPATSPLDRPTSISPSLSTSSSSKSFNYGFNAWSNPSSTPNPFDRGPSPTPSLRSAPPARPHPAEFMMDNPFANVQTNGNNGSSANIGGGGNLWGSKMETGSIKTWKREEELANNNPW